MNEMFASPGERVVRDGLRHPVAARVGSLVRLPAQELRELAPLGLVRLLRLVPALVAVEQPGRDRDPGVVDGGERRDHRRDRDRAGSMSPSASSARCGPSCHAIACVVLEPLRARHVEVVRDARPGDDVAVVVGRDRLHRRRADVDPDGDVRRAMRSDRRSLRERLRAPCRGADRSCTRSRRRSRRCGRRSCSTGRRLPR